MNFRTSRTARLLLCSIGALAGACALFAPKLEKPTLTVVSVDVLSGNVFEQNFRVKLKIQNPNDRPLPVQALSARLAVTGDDLAQGVTNNPFVVPAMGETEFDMTVSANMAAAVLKLANSYGKKAEALDYTLTGKISIDLPMLRSIPFHQSGKFSLNR